MRRADLDICECGLRHWPEELAAKTDFSLVVGGENGIWLSGDAPKHQPALNECNSTLSSLGVRTVVDVREAESRATVWGSGDERLVLLPVSDSDEGFSSPEKWVEGLLAVPPGRTLVHCHMGVNRSATAVAVMMWGRGYSPRDAVSAVLEARASALAVYAPKVFSVCVGAEAGREALDAIQALRGSDRRLAETDLLRGSSSFRVWDSLRGTETF